MESKGAKRDLRVPLGRKTKPTLRRLLINHLFSPLLSQADSPQTPPLLSNIDSNLRAIGGLNLWKGYIPTSAITLQASYAKETVRKKPKQKDTPWGVKMCCLIHRKFLALWKLQNKKRHGRNATENHARKREKFLARAKAIQETAKALPSKQDQDLLKSDTNIEPWPTFRIVAFVD